MWQQTKQTSYLPSMIDSKKIFWNNSNRLPFASPSFGFVGIHCRICETYEICKFWKHWIGQWRLGGPSSELNSFELASFSCTLKNSDRLRACNCTKFMQFSGLKNILKNLVSKCGCHNFHFNPYDLENTLHSFIGADILSSVRLSEWESLHEFCYCL